MQILKRKMKQQICIEVYNKNSIWICEDKYLYFHCEVYWSDWKRVFSLRYGMVISERFDKEKYYVIDCEDVFGNGHIDKEYMVYGATEIYGCTKVRISKSNAQFWKIEGEIE